MWVTNCSGLKSPRIDFYIFHMKSKRSKRNTALIMQGLSFHLTFLFEFPNLKSDLKLMAGLLLIA